MQELIKRIGDVFINFTVFDGLGIILLSIFFYLLFKVLKNHNGKMIILIFSLFLIICGVVVAGNSRIDNIYILLGAVIFESLILLIFSTEIKQAIWNQDTKSVSVAKNSTIDNGRVEGNINDIIKALQNMSKGDIGALIILSNNNLPKQILDSGVMLDATISSQLIEGTFFPKAPLHDGAMIITGHKIQAAGCFLPLTQSVNLPKDLGTRHRAGIGITEIADVTALIVSEETGIISIARQGKIARYADYDMLKKELENYYWKDLNTAKKGRA